MSAATERVAEWTVPCLDPDPGPMARLEAVQAAANTPSVVFQRVAEGETLKDIARAWQIPVGRFTEWFTTEHAALYDAALRVRADQLAHEALERADGADEKTVPTAKLQVDTRLRLAEKWDRQRYGAAKDAGMGGITVVVDRTCQGTVQIEAPGGSKLTIAGSGAEASHAGNQQQAIEGETSGDHDSRTAG